MHNNFNEEKRQSRIKVTRNFLALHTKAGYLNNTKWRELMGRVCELNIPFVYKKLMEENWQNCSFIRELEETSLLLDDTGDFTEFLEIEALKVPCDESLLNFLNLNNISYRVQNDNVVIQAYSLDH